MMIVRNRVNMRAVYLILSLLLISCSKDDASETPGKFELQSISIGEKQDQSSFVYMVSCTRLHHKTDADFP